MTINFDKRHEELTEALRACSDVVEAAKNFVQGKQYLISRVGFVSKLVPYENVTFDGEEMLLYKVGDKTYLGLRLSSRPKDDSGIYKIGSIRLNMSVIFTGNSIINKANLPPSVLRDLLTKVSWDDNRRPHISITSHKAPGYFGMSGVFWLPPPMSVDAVITAIAKGIASVICQLMAMDSIPEHNVRSLLLDMIRIQSGWHADYVQCLEDEITHLQQRLLRTKGR